MQRYLIVYCTNSGSTAEVANAIADEQIKAGNTAVVHKIGDAIELGLYDTVIVGAPMILGWHADALRFLRKHRAQLAGRRVALFACAMRLTLSEGESQKAIPLTLDANLVERPSKTGRLSFKERFTTLDHYLDPMMHASRGLNVTSTAFFKGKLEMYRLKWWQAAFVMAAVQAPAGDYRDWDLIRSWSRSLNDA